jgi:hypothetical protein
MAIVVSITALLALAACTPPPVSPTGDWALVGGPVVPAAGPTSAITRLDPSGNPVVATSVNGQANAQIAVSAWRTGAWVQLGSQLNTMSGAYLTGLELDGAGNPYVAWVEGGSGYLSHWDGSAWTAVGSPIPNIVNQGLFIASGAPLTIGYYQNNGLPPTGRQLFIGTWTGSSWTTTGPRNLPNYTTAFPVAVTMDGTSPVVVWQGLQPNGFIWSYIVERYASSTWASLGLVFTPDGNYGIGPVLLAVGNGSINVGWSETGSIATPHGVQSVTNSYVDQWDGSTWASLGGNLGPSSPKALIADAADNLTVARSASNSATVATWNGSAWVAVGGPANVGLTVQSDTSSSFSLSRSAHWLALSWFGSDPSSSINQVRVSEIPLAP